jgi:hypothetical protein
MFFWVHSMFNMLLTHHLEILHSARQKPFKPFKRNSNWTHYKCPLTSLLHIYDCFTKEVSKFPTSAKIRLWDQICPSKGRIDTHWQLVGLILPFDQLILMLNWSFITGVDSVDLISRCCRIFRSQEEATGQIPAPSLPVASPYSTWQQQAS